MSTILITGTNKGLGLQFVRKYAEDGWRVYAACRTPDNAGDLNAIAAASNGQVSVHKLDVLDFGAMDALAAELDGVALDILMNNAGIKGKEAQGLGQVDYDNWDMVFRTNVMSVEKMMEAFIGQVERGERKLIVNIASGTAGIARKKGKMAQQPNETYVYRSSKTALNMLTKCLAVELADRGVSVVALRPGWVRTDLGGPYAKFSIEESVDNCRPLIETFGMEQSGKYILYDGNELPY